MRSLPSLLPVDDAPAELLDSGHLWLLECVQGAPLRFQVQGSGLVRFGDRDRSYDDPTALPERSQCAVRHVRDRLDRDALREAVADPTDVVFVGVATGNEGIDYDWERMPAFLGYDVWSAERDAFLGPDAVAAIFERLGLEPANALERELPTRDFDPDSYLFPQSAWYDGPAAGVVIRNKRGGRARLPNEDVEVGQSVAADTSTASDASAEALAAEFATPARFERHAGDLAERGQSVSAEPLAERVLADVAREAHPRRYRDGPVDCAALRSDVGARARAFLDDRPDDAW